MMKIGDRQFDVENDCYVMGILNVTPDSFSDGGKWNDLEAAKQHTAQMLEEGASIIDIGGESTRPGHVQISDQEEIDRVLPMIEMVKSSFDVPVSIDSYKSPVVEAALKAGADLVNDIWGLKYDRKVADLIAQYQVPCVLMHNREKAEYHNFLGDLCQDMRDSLAIAKSAGIQDSKIILDPGVGFGKTMNIIWQLSAIWSALWSWGILCCWLPPGRALLAALWICRLTSGSRGPW